MNKNVLFLWILAVSFLQITSLVTYITINYTEDAMNNIAEKLRGSKLFTEDEIELLFSINAIPLRDTWGWRLLEENNSLRNLVRNYNNPIVVQALAMWEEREALFPEVTTIDEIEWSYLYAQFSGQSSLNNFLDLVHDKAYECQNDCSELLNNVANLSYSILDANGFFVLLTGNNHMCAECCENRTR